MADPSKTEKPTAKKRKQARDEGRVAKSVEASSAIIFVALLFLLQAFGSDLFYQMYWLTQTELSQLHQKEFTVIFTNNFVSYLMTYMGWVLWPFVSTILVVVIVINIIQVGFKVTWKPIRPRFSRLNPIKGAATKFFSKETLMNMIKSVGKMVIAVAIVYTTVRKQLAAIVALQYAELEYGLLVLVKLIMQILWRLTIFFVILAIIDWIYQKWRHEQDLKMTKEEVKEERKKAEGNPQIKSALRRRQRQAAQSRMMAAVPDADVVVTNPIHVAVAIKYDSETMRAPTVVAKGAVHLAERIKQIAREARIPVVENKPLAQSLYKLVEINDEIPQHLFNAVAEILSYVHRVTGKMFGLPNEQVEVN